MKPIKILDRSPMEQTGGFSQDRKGVGVQVWNACDTCVVTEFPGEIFCAFDFISNNEKGESLLSDST